MRFLLDTCVVSELCKPRPAEAVVAWVEQTPEHDLALSVMTLGELQKGVDRLAPGRRRDRLAEFLESVAARFDERLLPVTVDVARSWGSLCATAVDRGKPVSGIDAIIAATAKVHALTVVTRNVSDFAPTAVKTLNPF